MDLVSKLPLNYRWLELELKPKMLVEALKLYGLREYTGPADNPVILQLAEEIGVKAIYKRDSEAWCAVIMCAVALRAGKQVNFTGYARLRAKSFEKFGVPVLAGNEMLGDVLVFKRDGGYHVGLYIAEDDTAYHVWGGNQGNMANITRIAKNRLHCARRPIYNIQPANVRKVFMTADGELSTNES